jgi:hypothetical protein
MDSVGNLFGRARVDRRRIDKKTLLFETGQFSMPKDTVEDVLDVLRLR